jgi:hypothetical protein
MFALGNPARDTNRFGRSGLDCKLSGWPSH